MHRYKFNNITYYLSKDLFDKDFERDWLKRYMNRQLFHFTKRRAFREILDEYQKLSGLDGYILMHAHGTSNKRRFWSLVDGKRRINVQNWINRHDGEGLAMLLRCCNPRKEEIYSEKSIIIHPKDDINFVDLIRGGHLRIFVPKIGYLQDRKCALTETIEKIKNTFS